MTAAGDNNNGETALPLHTCFARRAGFPAACCVALVLCLPVREEAPTPQ